MSGFASGSDLQKCSSVWKVCERTGRTGDRQSFQQVRHKRSGWTGKTGRKDGDQSNIRQLPWFLSRLSRNMHLQPFKQAKKTRLGPSVLSEVGRLRGRNVSPRLFSLSPYKLVKSQATIAKSQMATIRSLCGEVVKGLSRHECNRAGTKKSPSLQSILKACATKVGSNWVYSSQFTTLYLDVLNEIAHIPSVSAPSPSHLSLALKWNPKLFKPVVQEVEMDFIAHGVTWYTAWSQPSGSDHSSKTAFNAASSAVIKIMHPALHLNTLVLQYMRFLFKTRMSYPSELQGIRAEEAKMTEQAAWIPVLTSIIKEEFPGRSLWKDYATKSFAVFFQDRLPGAVAVMDINKFASELTPIKSLILCGKLQCTIKSDASLNLPNLEIDSIIEAILTHPQLFIQDGLAKSTNDSDVGQSQTRQNATNLYRDIMTCPIIVIPQDVTRYNFHHINHIAPNKNAQLESMMYDQFHVELTDTQVSRFARLLLEKSFERCLASLAFRCVPRAQEHNTMSRRTNPRFCNRLKVVLNRSGRRLAQPCSTSDKVSLTPLLQTAYHTPLIHRHRSRPLIGSQGSLVGPCRMDDCQTSSQTRRG
ncbi:hypothetical protein VP01_709g1 [Puccinia sorghi]|uniref:Uncharacterized protein n=1 Tax=Puccinia sorghi TaxID=27349 RepID=A0A0L6UDL3_9BASI|nr:hypothetical protein VP01_709g1 [Puccinia sorghi]